MDELIVPLTKSPLPFKGRVGKLEDQDWFVTCQLAVERLRKSPRSKIAIISDVEIPGAGHEAHHYLQTFTKMGVSDGQILFIKAEHETIGQIERALIEASRRNMRLMFISSALHYPRVRWLTLGKNVSHRVVYGTPRPKEALTDLLLAVAFPVLDLLGFRRKFQEMTRKRRLSGKI